MRLNPLGTDKIGISRVNVPRETFALIEAARVLVSNVLLSSQPRHVGIGMAWRSHKEVDSKDVRTMLSVYMPTPGERDVVNIPLPLAREMRRYCKTYGIRIAVLLHHICRSFVVSLATKATLKASGDAALQMAADLIEVGEDNFAIKKIRSSKLDERRAEVEYRIKRSQENARRLEKKKEDKELMKFEAYMGKLEQHLEELGGIETFLANARVFRMHSMPLTEYSESELALPRAENPWAEYEGKLSRRGRGYQLVLYARLTDSGTTSLHPLDRREISWPLLYPGTSFRVRDVWENIDWAATRLTNT